MERDFLTVPAELDLDTFLRQPEHRGAMRHVVVTEGNRIAGVVRINTALRSGVAPGVTLGDVARRDFTVVREVDVAFDVIQRMWRKGGAIALVVRAGATRLHIPRPGDIIGVIGKEHVADAIASGIQVYPR
jgi:CIC family chloride channel protein